MAKCRYANVEQDGKVWNAVIDSFRLWSSLGCDPGQSVSCAARDGFKLTDEQWNAPMGNDAFASAIAILVMSKEVELRIPQGEKIA